MDKEKKKIKKSKFNVDEEIANEISVLGKHEVGEDSTKYGEFVSSYFAWISLPEQKENAERLQNITKGKEKNQD